MFDEERERNGHSDGSVGNRGHNYRRHNLGDGYSFSGQDEEERERRRHVNLEEGGFFKI